VLLQASGTLGLVAGLWRDALGDVWCFVLQSTGEGINAMVDMIDVAFGYDDGVWEHGLEVLRTLLILGPDMLCCPCTVPWSALSASKV